MSVQEPAHASAAVLAASFKSAWVHESVARTCEPPSIGDRGISNPWPQSQPLRIFDMICHGRRSFSPSEEGVRSPCRGEGSTPENLPKCSKRAEELHSCDRT